MLQQQQKVSKSKGLPRVTLWNRVMEECGFSSGQRILITSNRDGIVIVPDETGRRRVSNVKNHGKTLPVIDLKQTKSLDLTPLGAIGEPVEVTFKKDLITIRPVNVGGSPTEVDSLSQEDGRSRNPRSLPDRIPKSHFLSALDRIDRDGISPHSQSTTYDVVIDGNTYPPLALIAFALEDFDGEVIEPGTIRGGKGTQAFRILAKAGFNPVAKYFQPTSDNNALEDRVEEIRANEPLGTPPKGNKRPAKRPVAGSESVERDPAVKRWILDSADGGCELCGQHSPYRSKSKGNPWYLEVHHVVPLKDDGPDTVCNAVALCPNCHTRCHQSIEAEEATQELYEGVARLVKPG